MAKVLQLFQYIVLNSDVYVQPILTQFAGFVYGALRHNILKFERNRPAGSGKAKIGILTPRISVQGHSGSNPKNDLLLMFFLP